MIDEFIALEIAEGHIDKNIFTKENATFTYMVIAIRKR